MEKLILELNSKGWRLHNLYQGESKWEARIKLASSTVVYGSGEGHTPHEALQAALKDGLLRKEWRPRKPAIQDVSPRSSPQPTTTDNLMEGLDL